MLRMHDFFSYELINIRFALTIINVQLAKKNEEAFIDKKTAGLPTTVFTRCAYMTYVRLLCSSY